MRQLRADDRPADGRKLRGRDLDDAFERGRRLRPVRQRPGRPAGRQLDLTRRPREGRALESRRRDLHRQHACLARPARRHLPGQGDDERRRAADPGRHRQRPLPVRPGGRAGDGRGAAPRRRGRLCPRRARRGEDARRDPELPAAGRPDPARPGLERRPVPALRRRDARQSRAQLLQQHEAVHGPVRVHVEADVRLRAVDIHAGALQRDEGELDDGRFREVREPHLPGGLQRHPRRLSRHRRARRPELARPLRRRREGRGLDLGQLEGHARLGRPGPRQGPGPQSRLHRLHPQHLGLGRGPGDPEAAERVPRLEDQPDRPRHGPVRRDRLGADLGRPLPVHDGRHRCRPEPVRGGVVGQPEPLRLRLGQLRAAAVGVPRQGAAAGHPRPTRTAASTRRSPRARPGTRTSSTSCWAGR